MFKEAYTAAMRFYKMGPWYINADIWGGLPTQRQFTSLQAFWPGTSQKIRIHHSGVCGLAHGVTAHMLPGTHVGGPPFLWDLIQMRG